MLGLQLGKPLSTVVMTKYLVLLVAIFGGGTLVGCGQPDESGVPQAWTKLDDHSKLEKIKNMPLSPQQKADAIQKLNVPEDDKQKAIAEVKAGGSSQPTSNSGSATSSPPSGG